MALTAVQSIGLNFVVADDPKDEVLKAKITIKQEDVEAVVAEINHCGPGNQFGVRDDGVRSD